MTKIAEVQHVNIFGGGKIDPELVNKQDQLLMLIHRGQPPSELEEFAQKLAASAPDWKEGLEAHLLVDGFGDDERELWEIDEAALMVGVFMLQLQAANFPPKRFTAETAYCLGRCYSRSVAISFLDRLMKGDRRGRAELLNATATEEPSTEEPKADGAEGNVED